MFVNLNEAVKGVHVWVCVHLRDLRNTGVQYFENIKNSKKIVKRKLKSKLMFNIFAENLRNENLLINQLIVRQFSFDLVERK